MKSIFFNFCIVTLLMITNYTVTAHSNRSFENEMLLAVARTELSQQKKLLNITPEIEKAAIDSYKETQQRQWLDYLDKNIKAKLPRFKEFATQNPYATEEEIIRFLQKEYSGKDVRLILCNLTINLLQGYQNNLRDPNTTEDFCDKSLIVNLFSHAEEAINHVGLDVLNFVTEIDEVLKK